jgi:hypothetical protein
MDFRQVAEAGTAMGAQTGMWRWWPAFGATGKKSPARLPAERHPPWTPKSGLL